MSNKKSYFPSFKFLTSGDVKLEIKGELKHITLALPIFSAIIREYFLINDFDEDFYINKYPDVKQMLLESTETTALDHFITTGYFENRQWKHTPVNEDWYKTRYPDVWDSIRKSDIPNAAQHYILSGEVEGRIPDPELEKNVIYWLKKIRN